MNDLNWRRSPRAIGSSRLDVQMKPTRLGTARRLPLAAGFALLLAAAGCGGGTTTPTAGGASSTAPAPSAAPTSSTGPATPGTPAGPGRCHTADLTAHLRPLDSAAGQRYAAVQLTNRSASTCRVFGYGGVQLLDANHQPLPTRQVRDPLAPPRLVLLEPGASASSRLHWGVVPADTESQTGPCEPTPAQLLVTPPDETQPIAVPWPYGPVCQHGRIDQTAYAAGATPSDIP